MKTESPLTNSRMAAFTSAFLKTAASKARSEPQPFSFATKTSMTNGTRAQASEHPILSTSKMPPGKPALELRTGRKRTRRKNNPNQPPNVATAHYHKTRRRRGSNAATRTEIGETVRRGNYSILVCDRIGIRLSRESTVPRPCRKGLGSIRHLHNPVADFAYYLGVLVGGTVH